MSKLRIFKFRKFKSDVPRVMVGGWWVGRIFPPIYLIFWYINKQHVLISNVFSILLYGFYRVPFFFFYVGKNIQLVINLQLFLSILTKKSFLLFERESYSWWIRRPIHQERLKRFMIEDLQPGTININAVTI